MSTPIDDYLEELARRLRRTPGLAARVLEEVREHLEESAEQAGEGGLERELAEADAVARFGPARALARDLLPPLRRRGLRPLALAVVLSLFAGLAFAQVAGPPELIALVTTPHSARTSAGAAISGLGETRLVSLDAATLTPQGSSLPLPVSGHVRYLGFLPHEASVRAPDGRQLGIVIDGAVTLYGLAPLRRTGLIRFAPATAVSGPRRPSQERGSLDVVRAAAWLRDGHIVLVVQHQGPPYASRITRRTLVVIDPIAGRVVLRSRLDLRGTIQTFASGGDELVLLACRGNAVSLYRAGSSGRASRVATGTTCPRGQGAPALAVRPDGSAAALVGSDGSPVVVDLAPAPLRVRRLPRVLDVPATAFSSLALRFVGSSLALTGALSTGAQHWRARGVGVIFVDPRTGDHRVLARRGSRLLVTGDTVIVSGFDSHGLGYSPGSGITAYSRAGKLLWHSDGRRLVKPFVVAGHVYARRGVKRHSLVDVFDLGSGKVTASVFEPGIGITPLTGVIDSIGA